MNKSKKKKSASDEGDSTGLYVGFADMIGKECSTKLKSPQELNEILDCQHANTSVVGCS